MGMHTASSESKIGIMDSWLAHRVNDSRFTNERRVTVASGGWYLDGHRFQKQTHTFSASEAKSGDSNHTMTPHKDDSPKKSKKLKRKKGSKEFTEAEKKRLRNRESSDDSDSGGCWCVQTHQVPTHSKPNRIPCHDIDAPVLLPFLQVGLRIGRRQEKGREG